MCLSKYIIKTLETKSQFIPSYTDVTNNSHNNMNIAFIIEVCTFLYYYKMNQNIVESHVLLKKSQFISSYVDVINNSHNNMNIAFIVEVCPFLYYSKI